MRRPFGRVDGEEDLVGEAERQVRRGLLLVGQRRVERPVRSYAVVGSARMTRAASIVPAGVSSRILVPRWSIRVTGVSSRPHAPRVRHDQRAHSPGLRPIVVGRRIFIGRPVVERHAVQLRAIGIARDGIDIIGRHGSYRGDEIRQRAVRAVECGMRGGFEPVVGFADRALFVGGKPVAPLDAPVGGRSVDGGRRRPRRSGSQGLRLAEWSQPQPASTVTNSPSPPTCSGVHSAARGTALRLERSPTARWTPERARGRVSGASARSHRAQPQATGAAADRSPASTSNTSAPASCSARAAAMPAAPRPTTTVRPAGTLTSGRDQALFAGDAHHRLLQLLLERPHLDQTHARARATRRTPGSALPTSWERRSDRRSVRMCFSRSIQVVHRA